jgi:serine acetyltransferase
VLGGTVKVGELTHVGIGATVKNNIAICSGCTIGAGAVVVKDISEKGIYIGVPAKRKK